MPSTRRDNRLLTTNPPLKRKPEARTPRSKVSNSTLPSQTRFNKSQFVVSLTLLSSWYSHPLTASAFLKWRISDERPSARRPPACSVFASLLTHEPTAHEPNSIENEFQKKHTFILKSKSKAKFEFETNLKVIRLPERRFIPMLVHRPFGSFLGFQLAFTRLGRKFGPKLRSVTQYRGRKCPSRRCEYK